MDLSQLNLGGSSQPSGTTGGITLPGMENVQNIQSTLNTVVLWAVIFAGLFLLLYIVSLIQKARANHAIIAMRKDLTAIRVALERSSTPTTPPEPQPLPTKNQSTQINL